MTPGGSGLKWALYPQKGLGRGQAAPSSRPETQGCENVCIEPPSSGALAVSSGDEGDPASRAGQDVGGGLAQHSDPGGSSCPGARTVGRLGEPPAGVMWHAQRGTKGPLGILMPRSSRGGSARKYNVCWVFFIKVFMGSGNLNAAEPELNWKAKVSKLVHLKGKKNSIKQDFSCFNKIGLSLFKIRALGRRAPSVSHWSPLPQRVILAQDTMPQQEINV